MVSYSEVRAQPAGDITRYKCDYMKEVTVGMETTNVYVNLEGQSFRVWCLGSEMASEYLYIARIKFNLLGRGT